MRFIPTKFHAPLDYIVGVALIAAPWIFQFSEHTAATVVPVVLGIGLIAYSLFTNYELGVWKITPMAVHNVFDVAAGTLLPASPWIFGFADKSANVWAAAPDRRPGGRLSRPDDETAGRLQLQEHRDRTLTLRGAARSGVHRSGMSRDQVPWTVSRRRVAVRDRAGRDVAMARAPLEEPAGLIYRPELLSARGSRPSSTRSLRRAPVRSRRHARAGGAADGPPLRPRLRLRGPGSRGRASPFRRGRRRHRRRAAELGGLDPESLVEIPRPALPAGSTIGRHRLMPSLRHRPRGSRSVARRDLRFQRGDGREPPRVGGAA